MAIFATEEADIYYEIHGDGPPVLLIAGTACDSRFWMPYQVPDLSRDHLVIVFDQRGTGKTTSKVEEYSTTQLASDAAGLIKRVGRGPATVVGHSMGGRVAQLIALEHPETVRSLILLSTGASFKTKGGIPPGMCLGILNKGYESYIREHNMRIGFSTAFAVAHPGRVQECIDVIVAALPPVEVYFAHVMSRQEHDTSRRLGDIKAPTLVVVGGDEVHGNSDTTHVASSQQLAEGISGAIFVVIPEHGHFYAFSAPDTVNGLIRDFVAKSAGDVVD